MAGARAPGGHGGLPAQEAQRRRQGQDAARQVGEPPQPAVAGLGRQQVQRVVEGPRGIADGMLAAQVVDQQGREVRVGLYDARFGVPLANDLFATPSRKGKDGKD